MIFQRFSRNKHKIKIEKAPRETARKVTYPVSQATGIQMDGFIIGFIIYGENADSVKSSGR
jgi:hypothetical protein